MTNPITLRLMLKAGDEWHLLTEFELGTSWPGFRLKVVRDSWASDDPQQ
ncbi:MAG: hypothetical protein WAS05_00740 [Candidatus Nanopelagicales bacterium]